MAARLAFLHLLLASLVLVACTGRAVAQTSEALAHDAPASPVDAPDKPSRTLKAETGLAQAGVQPVDGANGRGARLSFLRNKLCAAPAKDPIRRAIEAHTAEVRACLEHALARRLRAIGRVVVQFSISANGKVEQSRAKTNDTGAPELGACIATRLRSWSFPKPAGHRSVEVTYPFVFEPERPTQSPLLTPTQAAAPSTLTADEYVQRFGTCTETWRSGHVPSTEQRKSLDSELPGKNGLIGDVSASPEVMERLNQYLYQVKACYDFARSVPSWAETEGNLRLRVALAGDGGVVAARVVTSELVPELGCCIQNAALEWTFPAVQARALAEFAFEMVSCPEGAIHVAIAR